MKTLTLFLALACAAMAQFTANVPGVTLTGPVADPTIENHSGKSVIAALSIFTPADRKPWVQNRLFTHDALGLPDGGSERLGAFSKYQKFESPIVSAKIGAIIFADGEFREEDSYQDAVGVSIPANFQSDMERHFQSMRNVWMMAKAGNWAGVQAKADAGDWSHDTFGTAVAVRLLEEVDYSRQPYGRAV